jgi:hypothetical protein
MNKSNLNVPHRPDGFGAHARNYALTLGTEPWPLALINPFIVMGDSAR